MKSLEQSQEIVRNQDLPITASAGADADGRDIHGFGNPGGQIAGEESKNQRESAGRSDGASIFEKPGGIALNAKAPEPMNRLRSQADVAHDGDVSSGNRGDRVRAANTSFELDGLSCS